MIPHTVHILRGGVAYCQISGVPGVWPSGHAWISFEDPDACKANCPKCVAVRDGVEQADPTLGYTAAERAAMLSAMQEASNDLYRAAFRIGCHPFIEFVGLINEYIKICQTAHREGFDFTEASAHSGRALPIQPYEAAYLGEKLGCIFGPSLEQPINRGAFLRAAGLLLESGQEQRRTP